MYGICIYFLSHEEFKNILGDISFLRSKKNSMNLFSTLKSSAQSYMSRQFDEIMEEENLSELFAKKNSLTPEEVEYVFNNCLNYVLVNCLAIQSFF